MVSVGFKELWVRGGGSVGCGGGGYVGCSSFAWQLVFLAGGVGVCLCGGRFFCVVSFWCFLCFLFSRFYPCYLCLFVVSHALLVLGFCLSLYGSFCTFGLIPMIFYL